MIVAAIAAYLLAMMGLGLYAARRTNSSADFMVAGRNLGLSMATATMLATWMGAATIMGAAGAAYRGGFLAVIADPFGAGLCLLLAGLFVVRLLRRLELVTITEFLAQKYDTTTGLLAALGLLIAYVGWTAAQFVAFGLILNTFTGLDTVTGILIGAAIVLTYTAFGGMWAVALTDFVQMAVMLVGLLFLYPLALQGVGGWSGLTEALPNHSFRIVPLEHSVASWVDYVRDWMVLGVGSLAAQDMLQRTFSSKSEAVAQNSAYLAGIGYLSLGMVPVLLGMIGSVSLPGLTDPETVVPRLAMEHLSAFPLAVFISALLAAIMSSSDSALLASASIITSNLLPALKRNVTERDKLMTARWSIPVIGAVALVVGLTVQQVYELAVNALAVILVVLVVPTVLAIWWPKANRSGALAAMITGYVVWIGLPFIAPGHASDFWGFLAGLIVMLVVSPLTQRRDPPKPVRHRDGNIEPLVNRLGVIGM